MSNSTIGLIGLAVMGANLARNFAAHGVKVIVNNRTNQKVEDFVTKYKSENIEAAYSLEDLISKLPRPRKIILMVKAGKPVDEILDKLVLLLDEGDIVVDCGNSFYKETNSRFERLIQHNIHFVGCGVSGGEEGALNGPSLMPGGTREVWEMNLQKDFEAIAANDFGKGKCVSLIGDKGAGHYVKMVHNGIEYGVMQIIAEAYSLLNNLYSLKPDEISRVFAQYNQGKLKSYLFEIAVEVLLKKDELTEGFLIDKILDKAGSKGTGMWTSVDALERGVPVQTITSAVFARYISSQKQQREALAKKISTNRQAVGLPGIGEFVERLEKALFIAVLSSYAQGFELINSASKQEGWDVDFAELARIWQGGCIIRAEILKVIENSFEKTGEYENLFEMENKDWDLTASISALREVVGSAVRSGVPIPAMYGSLEYFESMTSDRLGANFIQGLRDYFGAHTYERVDREGVFHTEWKENSNT